MSWSGASTRWASTPAAQYRYAEGLTAKVTSLGPHTLEVGATNTAAFTAWSCYDAPAAGDPAFPTGTTTGAVVFGDTSATSTTVAFPGPGGYVIRATYADGTVEDRAYLVERPTPAISVSGVTSGAGTPGATVTPTISDTAGADGPLTYLHAATRGSNGLGMVVTDATLATSSLTYPAQTAEGDSIGWAWVLTDAYGRTSRTTAVVNLPSPGNFAASSSLGDYVDTTDGYSFAPTLSIPAGATVATTITRISDASSVTVTDDTTINPTATLNAADASLGEGFVIKSAVTLSGVTKNVYTHVFMEGTGSAAFDGVVAPSPTSDSKAAGVALANKTFSAFTDPNGLIDNYNAVTTNADGSCSWSGSGLGPYTPTSADGDSGTLELQARDSSNNVLASAIHTYDRAAVAGGSSLTTHDDTDYTTDVTPQTETSAGTYTYYEADGTTPKGQGDFVINVIAGAPTVSLALAATTGLTWSVTGNNVSHRAAAFVPVTADSTLAVDDNDVVWQHKMLWSETNNGGNTLRRVGIMEGATWTNGITWRHYSTNGGTSYFLDVELIVGGSQTRPAASSNSLGGTPITGDVWVTVAQKGAQIAIYLHQQSGRPSVSNLAATADYSWFDSRAGDGKTRSAAFQAAQMYWAADHFVDNTNNVTTALESGRDQTGALIDA